MDDIRPDGSRVIEYLSGILVLAVVRRSVAGHNNRVLNQGLSIQSVTPYQLQKATYSSHFFIPIPRNTTHPGEIHGHRRGVDTTDKAIS
jgi:hypothetical protein